MPVLHVAHEICFTCPPPCWPDCWKSAHATEDCRCLCRSREPGTQILSHLHSSSHGGTNSLTLETSRLSTTQYQLLAFLISVTGKGHMVKTELKQEQRPLERSQSHWPHVGGESKNTRGFQCLLKSQLHVEMNLLPNGKKKI